MKISLPTELEPWRVKFEQSIRPYLQISCEAKKDLSLWDSKFGGYPYLPKGYQIPKDRKGKEMILLAQINWEEIPHLEGYPTQGITQFFISPTKNFQYGCDFEKQNYWRVLHFTTNELYPPFGHKIGSYAGFVQDDWRKYSKNAVLKKIPKKNPWILLLQVQSDKHFLWGDCAVGNFFIHKQDLLQLNFSKVKYYWDCY